MKRQSLQKKRRSTSGGLFVFHSKTRRRKKQRVAAGAGAVDLGSEVPNLGVARALFVILILHVAAIAAIFIHNRVTNDEPVVPGTDESATAAAVNGQSTEKLPVVRKGEDFYFVATGDTYEHIARLKGVEVNALRDLNENVRLKAGRILRIPASGATAPAIASTRPRTNLASTEPSGSRVETPSAPPVAPAIVPIASTEPAPDVDARTALMIVVKRTVPTKPIVVEVEKPAASESAVATKVTPKIRPEEDPPAPASSAVGGTYKVQSGDTAWHIAQRHKVSVSALLETNGIEDARKMRAGMTLKIPTN